MKRKIPFVPAVFLALLLFAYIPGPPRVSADMGPKPSVTVSIQGLEGRTCYATLLSQRESTGPASAYDGENARYAQGDEGYEIWRAMADFQDADGFYFLQEFWDCTGTDSFRWGYYPPSVFKILLYFPVEDTFVVSGVCERYAFDSYFTMELNGEAAMGEPPLVEKSYDYTWEIVSLLVRIVLTIFLELLVALLFGWREKRQLLLLAGVNTATQALLNILLNLANYAQGWMMFLFCYVLLELVVFAVEAVVFSAFLPRVSRGPVKKGKAVWYAFAANALSFLAGLGLAKALPGIF